MLTYFHAKVTLTLGLSEQVLRMTLLRAIGNNHLMFVTTLNVGQMIQPQNIVVPLTLGDWELVAKFYT